MRCGVGAWRLVMYRNTLYESSSARVGMFLSSSVVLKQLIENRTLKRGLPRQEDRSNSMKA